MSDDPTGDKLYQMIIDKVLAIVTAVPRAGADLPADAQGSNPLQPDNTVVQLAIPGIPLYSEDFKNMFHPANTAGDSAKTALFSWLVDAIPAAGTLDYKQTPRRVSLAYQAIVNAANAHGPDISPAVKAELDRHNAVLYAADGRQTDDFKEYQKREDALDDAQAALRHVSKKAEDLALQYEEDYAPDFGKKPEDEQKRIVALYKRKAQDYFSDAYPAAKRSVLRALDGLDDVRMNRVEEALTFIRTHGKELSAHVLDNMKRQLQLIEPYTDQTLKVPVMLSFPSSTAFARPDSDSGWMPITINTAAYDEKGSETAKRTGGGGGGSWVLFFIRAGASQSEMTAHQEVSARDFQISFDLAVINILRPWMDATLFGENLLWDAGRDQKEATVSTGKYATQNDSLLLPFVPTQMLVARNVRITATWNAKEQDFFKQHMEAGGHIGWGPFSVGADHSQDTATFKKRGGSGAVALELQGIQCIGFVSWVPPRCAPCAGDTDARSDRHALVLPDAKELQRRKAAAEQVVAQLATPPKQRAAKA